MGSEKIRNIHYADKKVKLTLSSFDYVNYSIRLEQLKAAFKTLYSIFDQIAFFINEFWSLGLGEKQADAAHVFKSKKYPIDNSALLAILWSHSEFVEIFGEAESASEGNLRTLRNAIEHKFVKIHQYPTNNKLQIEDDSFYHISENELKYYVLRLLELSREWILIEHIFSMTFHKNEYHGGRVALSKVWAFLISVAEYDDKSYNLAYVHNDNSCITRGLVDGLLIPDNQIITCGIDCYVTYFDFQAMISSYFDKITLSDRVIVFFSGHGGGAPFSLKFSDKSIIFSEFCEQIATLPAHAKILIIDSCYSGSGEIPELSVEKPSSNLLEYTNSGFAFFASSNTGSTSTCHPVIAVSLYTHCFSNALCYARIHNGKISLIDVAKQASHAADYLAKTHGKISQHPVYKCYVPGDVLFQVTEERTEEKSIYSSHHEEFDVYSTEILHSAIDMRYSVFAIVKSDINDELIANYTKQIVNEVRHLRKFKNPSQESKFFGKSLNVVFVYWGKNETDIVRRNWCYRSIWASPLSDRANWYRLDKESKIVSDIWIKPHKLYCLLEEVNAKNEVSNTELLNLTHNIANPLLRAAYEVVKYFEEYDNGDIPEWAFIQACAEHFEVINNCHRKMSNLPLPSIELKEWADCYDCLTATIDDMRIYYTTKIILERDERNRKICMRGTVTRYRNDLQRLTHIENDLVKSGLIFVDAQ